MTLPDPDPTPTESPWQAYLAAAQSLDAVLREAAGTEAAAAATVTPAWEELLRIRGQLDRQRAQLLGEAVRSGLPAPQLLPTPTEQAAADAQVAGSPVGAAEALRHSQQSLAAADAQLAGPPMSPVPVPLVFGTPAQGMPVLGTPAQGMPVLVPAAAPVAPTRSYWPPPVWVLIVVPIAVASLALCVIGFVIFVTT